MKKELMDKKLVDMTLTEVLSVVNDGFWKGFSEEMKTLPIYYGATMVTGSVVWAIARYVSKKKSDNKD